MIAEAKVSRTDELQSFEGKPPPVATYEAQPSLNGKTKPGMSLNVVKVFTTCCTRVLVLCTVI